MHRCTLTWLHQTLIEALSPWQWRVQRDTILSLCGLETYPYPHTGLLKGVAERVPFASECQARERGSPRKPLTTLTAGEGGVWYVAPSLLVTVFYYSIPAGMLG